MPNLNECNVSRVSRDTNLDSNLFEMDQVSVLFESKQKRLKWKQTQMVDSIAKRFHVREKKKKKNVCAA